MKFTILGSGGMNNIPLPNCNCGICTSARNGNKKDQRFLPSLYLEDIHMLIDTPEDIYFSLDGRKVDFIGITHKDPDHTRGIRILESLALDWVGGNNAPVNLLISKGVQDDINLWLNNTLKYFSSLKIINVDNSANVKIKDIEIVQINNETNDKSDANVSIYVFKSNGKKLIYAPCDNKPFRYNKEYENADVLILGCVLTKKMLKGNVLIEESKLSDLEKMFFTLQEVIELKKQYNIKKMIITHIDDVWGDTAENYKKLEEKLDNIIFAYDGLRIEL